MTYLGFYLLMFLGYINQLFFVPKVAMEKNRDVSISDYHTKETLGNR
jgi:serine palmitoyltransferase